LPRWQDGRVVEWTLSVAWPDQHWWSDPDLIVTVIPRNQAHAVGVEFRHDEEGPFVTGVAVRRHTWADGWRGERTHVSARDIQRLPLTRIVQAALAAASTAVKPEQRTGTSPTPGIGPGETSWIDEAPSEQFPGPQWLEEARKVLVPRGRPQPGKSTGFYRQIAESHRSFARAGKSPVKEIARRKKADENTVHQWVYRARQLGFLEPSPRSKHTPRQQRGDH
jgi:hypothetical protein